MYEYLLSYTLPIPLNWFVRLTYRRAAEHHERHMDRRHGGLPQISERELSTER